MWNVSGWDAEWLTKLNKDVFGRIQSDRFKVLAHQNLYWAFVPVLWDLFRPVVRLQHKNRTSCEFSAAVWLQKRMDCGAIPWRCCLTLLGTAGGVSFQSDPQTERRTSSVFPYWSHERWARHFLTRQNISEYETRLLSHRSWWTASVEDRNGFI